MNCFPIEQLHILSEIITIIKNDVRRRQQFCHDPFLFLSRFGLEPDEDLIPPLKILDNDTLMFIEGNFEEYIKVTNKQFLAQVENVATFTNMDCELFKLGGKPSLRLCIPEQKAASVIRFCEENNAYYLFSPYKVTSIQEAEKKGFSNRLSKFRPLTDPIAGYLFIYVGWDSITISLLWFTEILGLYRPLGHLLGYPDCCIDFYGRNIKLANQQFQGDFISLIPSSPFETYLFYTNYVLRYFDVSLISHFPCNFNCRASIEIGKRNFRNILHFSTERANKIKESLCSLVIYSDLNGVFAFRDVEWTNNSTFCYSSQNIQATIKDNDLYQLLSSSHRINVKRKHLEVFIEGGYTRLPADVKLIRFCDEVV